MSENKKQDEQTQEQEPNTQATAQETDAATDNAPAQDAQDAEEQAPSDTPEETPDDIIAKLTKQIEDEKKEYLFLMAEFDNFRKRTIREKAELIRNGAEKALGDILPIVDDFERGLAATKNVEDAAQVREGMELIYQKLVKYLSDNGVKEMDTSAGTDFNADVHEAIATIPAPADDLKGKIIDTTQKGYMINDKVLRHAKVVVGE